MGWARPRGATRSAWPGYLEFDGALASSLDALEAGMPAQWWTHLFVHAADRALIGIGGYTGPPENGTVEIGYGFTRTAELDSEDGPIWRWELHLPAEDAPQ